MAVIIDGKATAQSIKKKLADLTAGMKSKPGIAVLQVGENPASQSYVNSKEKDSQEAGFYSEIFRLSENTTQEALIKRVEDLNARKEINGILVQLPLPKHMDSDTVLNKINVLKDVDGFTYISAGRLMSGKPAFVACTPKGIMKLIEETKEKIEGKTAVVIGRSNIVGKPMAMLLLNANATVTICHSKTKNLKEVCASADILVAAIGRAKFVTADMVKSGAIVIDVGINRVDGKLVGDVDFENVKDKCSFITPVPGGVGPMTRAMLMQNTYEAYLLQNERAK
ncbi:MAG: bifunctional methylenetetrahydrofolate dehydrogenase/methenyltetrahydrofolate cyclohydrolase FolD [bacterium]